MKYDAILLGKPVTDLAGQEMKIGNGLGDGGVVTLTVKLAFRRALDGIFPDEQPTSQNLSGQLSMADRLNRFEISKKIWNCETSIELKAEEQTELKKCVGKFFASPEVCGFLEAIIEGTGE